MRHHLHADRRHFHGDEVVALAHVEAPRVADIRRVREVDRLLGAHRAAAVARLFERHAVLMALGDIKKGAAIGAQQPLVGRERDEVGIELLHVEREHADALWVASTRSVCPGARGQRRRHAIEIDEGRRRTSAPTRSRPSRSAPRPAARSPPARRRSNRRHPAGQRLRPCRRPRPRATSIPAPPRNDRPPAPGRARRPAPQTTLRPSRRHIRRKKSAPHPPAPH